MECGLSCSPKERDSSSASSSNQVRGAFTPFGMDTVAAYPNRWLTTGEVTGFVLAQCRRLAGARSRKLVVTALRQLYG